MANVVVDRTVVLQSPCFQHLNTLHRFYFAHGEKVGLPEFFHLFRAPLIYGLERSEVGEFIEILQYILQLEVLPEELNELPLGLFGYDLFWMGEFPLEIAHHLNVATPGLAAHYIAESL